MEKYQMMKWLTYAARIISDVAPYADEVASKELTEISERLSKLADGIEEED